MGENNNVEKGNKEFVEADMQFLNGVGEPVLQ